MNLIVAETCPYCTKQRSPKDIIHLTGFKICVCCLEKHEKALDALASGRFTGECSECGTSVEELTARQADGDKGLRMAVIYEDGFYKVICPSCAATYIPKRKELFSGTEYAKQKGL